MSAALEALKATRKDVVRIVPINDGQNQIRLLPAPAIDVAMMMFQDPAFAELFDNVGDALGDKDFLAEVAERGTIGKALAGLVGICARDRSKDFQEALAEINADDFFTLAITSLEVSAPRGVADFFERVMRMMTVLGGTSTSSAAA